jgi:RNA polymerase sigma-70 factor (ECF subfamily)
MRQLTQVTGVPAWLSGNCGEVESRHRVPQIRDPLCRPARNPARRLPRAPVTFRSPEGAAARTPVDRVADPVSDQVRQIQAGIDVDLNSARLHKRFQPKVHFYFHEKGFPPEDCEELAQEVFLRAFKGIGQFAFRASFGVWLLEIAHNLWANEIRGLNAAKRDGVAVPLLEESDPDADDPGRKTPALAAAGPSPEEETLRKEQSAALRAAVATLPTQMRRCVQLRIEQERKYREIAVILGMSLDGVKAQIGQAKVRLRALLREEAGLGALDREDDA